MCTALGVDTPPTPDGRRVSLPGEDKNKKKKKRSSARTVKKKLVDYSVLEDSDVDESSLFGDDDKAVDTLTPIPLKATKGRRFVLSSPETETSDESEDEVETWKGAKRKPPKARHVKVKKERVERKVKKEAGPRTKGMRLVSSG